MEDNKITYEPCFEAFGYIAGQGVYGPYTDEDLEARAASSTVYADTLIRWGDPEWPEDLSVFEAMARMREWIES